MEIHEWIGKRKTSYFFDYYDRDGIKRRVTCDSLEEAEHSRESIKNRTRKKRKLFSGMAERWLGVKQSTVLPQTLQEYKGVVRRYVNPQFGDFNVDTITRAEVK